MNIKHVSFFIIISFLTAQSYGMEKEIISSKGSFTEKKTNVEQIKSQALQKTVATYITTANANKAYNLFNIDRIKDLTKEHRIELYKYAKTYNNNFLETAFDKNGTPLWDEDEVNTYFNRDAITNALRTLTVLPSLRIPQAFFTNAQRYRTPTNSPTPDQALLALIKSEQKKISLCCFYFDLDFLAKALIKKKNNGVKIKIITTQSQKNLHALKLLANNNITILAPQNDNFELNHHKFGIFKCNIFNKTILSHGSFNYTDSAIQRNWEDMALSDDSYLITQFKEQFKDIKKCSSKPKFLTP
jgi:hypothetical protein